MKNYIGISRDHSHSMWTIAKAAARDYNANILAVKDAAQKNNIDTIVSVVKCGVGSAARVDREVVNSNVQVLQPILESSYVADGHATPLWDSVGELIEMLSAVPDASETEVSFLIMVITDGLENRSRKWTQERLSSKIKELQATDRWTFVFRVPVGHARQLAALGIPQGNILEWDQTQHGIEVASAATTSAVSSYFTNRSQGIRSTGKFYADLSNVNIKEVKQNLSDISTKVTRYFVNPSEHGVAIKNFIEKWMPYRLGTVFYQLTKTEKIQEAKQICIADKNNGAIYTGSAARSLLGGLPDYGAITLAPHNLGNYDVFVQSTSVNRKLVGGTTVLYCADFAR